jgi:hypothetical protein
LNASPTSRDTIDPHITVTPSRHLHDGQQVQVEVRGFGPNQSLIVIECVDLGRKTGQSSCDIGHLSTLSVGASGTGATTFEVRTGPLGSGGRSCTVKQPCIVSVSQATLNPTQTASARIGFG